MKELFSSLSHSWKSLSLLFRILLIVALSLSVWIAVIGIQKYTIFGFDQSRDAFEAYGIIHDGHIKVLGPSTDIPGVFHGVLWYYLLAIPYAIKNIPEFAAGFFSILLFLSSIPVGILTEKLFKNTYITSLSFLLYILSPLFEMATHWLSNPILSLIVSPYILLLLWHFVQKPRVITGFLLGLCMGVLIQGEFAFGIFLLSMPVYWFYFKPSISFKQTVAFLFGLLIGISSFIIAEIKFHFQGVRGIIQFLHNTGHAHVTLETLSVNFLQRTSDLTGTSVFALPSVIVLFLLGIVCFVIITKISESNKKSLVFLSIWFGVLILFQFFSSGISSSYFLFFPFMPVVVIFIAFLLVSLFKNKWILFCIVCVLVFLQVHLSFSYFSSNILVFSVQQGETIPYEREIVDYTFQSVAKQPFTIITLTNPLYTNTTWAYWYQFYGLLKYGYLPYFGGRSQKGLIGNLPEKQFDTKIRYMIIEPTEGIPDVYVAKILYEEDKVSDLVEEKHFGSFIVQKRKLDLHKVQPMIPGMLLHSPILYE